MAILRRTKEALLKILSGLAGPLPRLAEESAMPDDQMESAKSEDGMVDLEVTIIHKNEEQQIAYGVVMEPDVFDAHGHVADRVEIEKAMTSFMTKKWRPIGLQHSDIGYGVQIVESALARKDFEMGDEIVKEGSWYIGVKCPDDVWAGIKRGEYTGFSIGAEARLEDIPE